MKIFAPLITFFIMATATVIYTPKGNAEQHISNDEKTVTVLELFTSQSCSSCPPADKFLGELSENDDIITLACHVDYWNYLHWEDTYSHAFCTQRQRDYARANFSSRVFTPELRINGITSLVGSQKSQIKNALKRQNTKIPNIPIHLNKTQNVLTAKLPNIKSGYYVIEAVYYEQGETVDIKRGENGGRTLSYTNPVKAVEIIDTAWKGSEKTITIPFEKRDHIALLVHRKSSSGQILAAGSITLEK